MITFYVLEHYLAILGIFFFHIFPGKNYRWDTYFGYLYGHIYKTQLPSKIRRLKVGFHLNTILTVLLILILKQNAHQS